MDENNALVILQQQDQALTLGGLGRSSSLFSARPAILELVQSSTKQENVQIGKFRDISTNEHFDEMRVVILGDPQKQRQFYEGKDFKKENRKCFSLDNVRPHPRAANPPAMFCSACPKGDINWNKWRITKDPKDLPPCKAYWHLELANRSTQMIYYFNVKGTGISVFEQAMKNQMARLLMMMELNVKAENKKRGYAQVEIRQNGQLIGYKWEPIPGLALPEGVTEQLPALPMPNIFDISFTMYPGQTEKGGPYVAMFKDFAAMKEQDRKEFGRLYLQLMGERTSGHAPDQEAIEQEAAAKEQIADAGVAPEGVPVAEILPPGEEPPITV